MSLIDLNGPVQVILLVTVFCCPIIPAGGWCWLKCVEFCLQGLGVVVKQVRKFAYIPMYLSLLLLLVVGFLVVIPDFFQSERTAFQVYAFQLFVVTGCCTVGSIFICVSSTVKILQGQASIDQQRERTVYIVALPSFYCLMCFLASQQLLIQILGTLDDRWSWDVTFESDEERLRFTLDMMSVYASAADVFESFAFTFFGMLTMESLRRAVDTAPHTPRTTARQAKLTGCVQRWTMSPLYMFCAVLCVEAVYSLIVVFRRYLHVSRYVPPALADFFSQLPGPEERVMTVTFFTLTSIFSSLAIMALISIERVFHEDLVGVNFVSDVSPRFSTFANLKFWGVKLFVSVEFAMQCCMHLVQVETLKKQLIYNVCMASLCFFMSLVHIRAYAPRGRWICTGMPVDFELGLEMTRLSSIIEKRDGRASFHLELA